jgi:hypothetical protein
MFFLFPSIIWPKILIALFLTSNPYLKFENSLNTRSTSVKKIKQDHGCRYIPWRECLAEEK